MDKNIIFDIIWLVASFAMVVIASYDLEPYEWQKDPLTIISAISMVAATIKFLFDIARKDYNYDNK